MLILPLRAAQRVQENWPPKASLSEELIVQDPDITLFELRDALADGTGVKVQHSAIGHLLKRLGFTHEKVIGHDRTLPRQGKAAA